MRYLRSKRGLAGLGALAVIASLTLLVVLPALASSSALVQQPSAAGIVPVDVPIGGNATCSSVFPKDSALLKWQSYYNNNPGNGTFASGNNDNVSFGLALTNGSNGQLLAITSAPNVAISGIAVNGGADNDAFDYVGQDDPSGYSTGWVSSDSKLHAPAKNANQNYTISHLNICYRLLATISGKVFNDAAGTGDSSQGAIAGASIGVFDNTTGKFSPATTGADGMFSSPQPIGDTYTVCAKLPATYANQSVPSGTTCGSKAGYVPAGYTVALGSGGSSGNNFGFQSLRTIKGQLYSDNNLDGQYLNSSVTPTDATLPEANWTVSLYDTKTKTVVGSGPTDATGAYNFKAPIVANDGYQLCLTQANDGKTWVQTQPAPGGTDCSSNVSGAMQWAFAFPGSGDETHDFGLAPGSPCSSTTGMSSTTDGSNGSVVALMPADSSGNCLKPNAFALASGTDPNLVPGKLTNYVGVAVAGDPTQNKWAPVVERITFPDPLTSGGVPSYTGLDYIAGAANTPRAMQPCTISAATLLDQTNGGDYGGTVMAGVKDLYLRHLYAGPRSAETGNTGANDPLPGGETACLISLTITGSSGDNPQGQLVARVYLSVDSQAWPH